MKTVEKSQLFYLKKRKIDYNRKYYIIKQIVLSLKPKSKVLELFGGVGITTFFIQKYMLPKVHKIIELDYECFEKLKHNFNTCTILNLDSFKIKEKWNDYDYIFYDYAFTPKKINDFNRFTNYKGTLIVTDTGIFHLLFSKEKNVIEYFTDLNSKFNKIQLYINKVFYTHKFSIILISNNKTEIVIEDANKYVYDNEWKKYVDKYVFNIQTNKLF